MRAFILLAALGLLPGSAWAGSSVPGGLFESQVAGVSAYLRGAAAAFKPSEPDYVQTDLCEGQEYLSRENPWEPEAGVHLHFRAKSHMERTASGRRMITYDFVVYNENPYDVHIKNPQTFLVEWQGALSQKVANTGLLYPSPLFFMTQQASDAELPAVIEHVHAAENRFMIIGPQNVFSASIFPDGPVRVEHDARLVVYDRNLKVRAAFACPAFVE